MKKTLKPYGIGVIGWILGLIILFGLAWPLTSPETVANAMVWALKHWWVAYALGFVILVVSGLRRKIEIVTSLVAYLLPMAVVVGLAMIFLMIYPNSGFREDLFSYISVSVVFYLTSMVWVSLDRKSEPDLTKASAAPLMGGVILLALVAVPVFTSNNFIYRNAFVLNVIEIQKPDRSFVAKCVLEIKKPGNYEFSSPASAFFEMIYEEATDGKSSPNVVVVWGAGGKPPIGALGKFPLEIHWKDVPAHEALANADSLAGAMPIFLEVRTTEQPDVLLYTVTSFMPESPEQQPTAN